jgi:hypothetical protein
MINPHPNELKRGNYILYLDELYVVTGLKEEGKDRRIRVYFSTLDGKLHNAKNLNWIQVVPLTVEILDNFGFEKCNKLFLTNHTTFILKRHQGEEPVYIIVNGQSFMYVVAYFLSDNINISQFNYRKIKFLHQLQNLNFGLSGDELEIKS